MTELLLGGELGPGGALQWTAPQAVVLAAVAVAVMAWLAAARGRRSAGSRALELSLWAAALAGMVTAVARPVWVDESERLEPGRVAVLVDASSSMGVLQGSSPRSDAVQPVLEHIASQAERVEWFSFGGDFTVGQPEAFERPDTDLEGALASLGERVAGERLAAVVLVTDGLDRGLLRRRFQSEDSPAPPALPGPLTIFQIGERADIRDLAVRRVDSGGYAFLRHPFTLRATIEGTGFEGRTVSVRLERDGALVQTQDVALGDDGLAEVAFEVQPDRDGRFAYEVSVPTYEHDAVPANNRLPLVVRVVRDRIRILQVAGAPSWDVKFLRRFLKGDPSVDLVSFFILRTGRDMDNRYGEDELSLIAFPYRDLFSTDLWTFDAVVFQNFDYEPYFVPSGRAMLENLRRYVEDDGGAVVMVGGDRSFGLGRYEGTALGDMLPVVIDNDERPATEAFRPRLTEAGARHPITRLVTERGENASWWARLHPTDGTNVVRRATPDATVLLEHPTLQGEDGAPLPVLAVREAGAGRTMALTVDSSWRWSMSEAAEGRGNQAYLRFWKNSLRWLMRDRSMNRVSVELARENYALGEDVRVVVRARDTDFAPLPGAEVELTVERGGSSLTRRGQTSETGEVVLTVPAERAGTHRVEVAARRGDDKVGEDRTVFAVTSRDPELDEVSPDEAFLRALAARVDGSYHAAGELGPVRVDPNAGRKVTDRHETALWAAPGLALWIGLFAGLAWIVRRRAGLR